LKEALRRVFPYFKGYNLYFFLAFIGVITTAAATAGTAKIMQYIVDDLLINQDEQMLALIPMILIGLYTAKGLGRYIQAYFTNYIGQDIIRRIRDELLEKMLHLEMAFFNDARNGELISRINNDIERLRVIVTNFIPEMIRDSLTLVFLLGVALQQSLILSFYALIVLPLIFYPLSRLAKRMKKISHRSQEKNADVISRLSEIFNNVEIIKAHANENLETDRFKEENKKYFKINMKGVLVNEAVSPIMEILGAVALSMVIVVGAREIMEGRMSVGQVVTFVTAVGMLYDPIRKIASMYNKMQDGVAASERLFEIMDTKVGFEGGSAPFPKGIQTITFHNVGMHYGEKEALRNINLTAYKNKTTALVGNSGGGKSSLVNLLVRFYDHSSGTITFNDIDSRELDLHELRKNIAIVSQRVYIFNDTLAQNIAYGLPFDRQKVEEVLRLANAQEFVASLNKGIDTILDEFGSNLSGGQRQRIAIARALYKNAPILILDEATSALDNKSEKAVQKALETFCEDKITFIIAHRLSTIEHADNILVFDQGTIVDQGTHKELIYSSVTYERLYNSFVK
jgi:subfamily B ATP-binding cassette protein MsbA